MSEINSLINDRIIYKLKSYEEEAEWRLIFQPTFSKVTYGTDRKCLHYDMEKVQTDYELIESKIVLVHKLKLDEVLNPENPIIIEKDSVPLKQEILITVIAGPKCKTEDVVNKMFIEKYFGDVATYFRSEIKYT